MNILEDKKIVLGISGSIAAYKSAYLCRLLIQEGAEVRVVMTPSAAKFISPLTMSTLSDGKVYQKVIDEDEWSNHVELGLWGDLLLIAPATAHSLAACANGLCHNMLQAVYLSAKCPVAVAPAMDRDMWLHPSTEKNIRALKSYGNHIIPVGVGALASGLHGPGRMAEPEDIVQFIRGMLTRPQSWKGIPVVVNAGPTYEPLDPVRFLGNHSTGKMGIAIARALQSRGAQVHLVLGPSREDSSGLKTTRVQTAKEMYEATTEAFKKSKLAILTAAVADYKPETYADQKIKKSNTKGPLSLKLTRTKDIAKSLGEIKTPNQLIVGFALETNDEEVNAQSKMSRKNMDAIALNSLNHEGAGFQYDTNRVTIFSARGGKMTGELKSKTEVASDLLDYLEKEFADILSTETK